MKNLVCLWALCSVIGLNAQTREENFKNSYAAELKKEYAKAIQFVERDEALEQCYECNFRLGWLHYLNGDNIKSIKHYKAALDLEKGSIEALYGLTYPYNASKQWDNLAAAYLEVLKISPSQINALYYLGLHYFYKKDYDKARRCCQKILDLYPINYYTNLFMGDIYNAEGNADKAGEYYKVATIYEMTKPEVGKVTDRACYACNLRLGWLAFNEKDYKESLFEYGKAVQLIPSSLEPYYGQTYSYAAIQDEEKLVSLYQKIISIDDKNTYAIYSLAYYQFKKQEMEAAEKNCEKVLKLFPFDYYTNQLMGNVKIALKKDAEAIPYLERALVYNPNENITKTKLQQLSKRK